MKYEIKPTKQFIDKFRNLSKNTQKIIYAKLEILEINPFRNKPIKGHNLLLFRIRFSDKSKEMRIVYSVNRNIVKILCILDRNNGYKNLKKYLDIYSK